MHLVDANSSESFPIKIEITNLKTVCLRVEIREAYLVMCIFIQRFEVSFHWTIVLSQVYCLQWNFSDEER